MIQPEELTNEPFFPDAMFPWGHAALAYVLYSGFTDSRYDSHPTDYHPVLLGFASLLPDVIDKPLAWNLNLIPVGRSIFHSLLILIPLAVTIYWISARRNHRRIGHTLLIGLLSHPLGDVLDSVFTVPRFEAPTYLLWPVITAPPPDENLGYAQLWAFDVGPFFYFETALVLAASVLWIHHGLPGLTWLSDKMGANPG